MFRNNCTFFNKNLTTENAKKLLSNFDNAIKHNNHSDAVKCYNAICKAINDRILQNYINPNKYFLNYSKPTSKISDPEKSDGREGCGFIVMGVNCILIELYYELIHGYDESSEGGKIQEAYEEVLPILDSSITKELAAIFYRGIRCGIIHQGQTKESTAITFEIECVIQENGGYYLCNPNTICNDLDELYKTYRDSLLKSSYDSACAKHLIEKYRHILDHI